MLRAATNRLSLVEPKPIDPNTSTMLEHLEYLKYCQPRTFDLLDKAVIADIQAIGGRANRLKEIRGERLEAAEQRLEAVVLDRVLALP